MNNHNSILNSLTSHFDAPCQIISKTAVYGGDINKSYKLETNLGTFFIKENDEKKFNQLHQLNQLNQLFQIEAIGLQELSKSTFKIPEVIVVKDNYLVLEWLEKGLKINTKNWRKFGVCLAKMHQINSESFGFESDNYIGSLPQKNTLKNTWADFFIENRLEVQVKMALDSGKISRHLLPLFERLYSKLENLFPKEKPSLLHGDLWSGNAMTTNLNEVSVFDPAIYYGHREMDLSMTKLFGGFNSEMYSSYHETFPLENGFEERVALCNLYPLLVHVNLFGGNYIRQVEQTLAHFV